MRYEIIAGHLRPAAGGAGRERSGDCPEVGKFIFARGAVEWDVTLPGRGFAGNVAAGFKRKVSGGAVVMTTCTGPGEVGFAGDLPGSIRAAEPAAEEATKGDRKVRAKGGSTN